MAWDRRLDTHGVNLLHKGGLILHVNIGFCKSISSFVWFFSVGCTVSYGAKFEAIDERWNEKGV